MKSAIVRNRVVRIFLVMSSALAALAVVMTSAPVPAQAPAALAVASVATPASASSSEPNFTVQDNRVILSWLEGNEEHATLKYAERTATGWSPAQTVHSSDKMYVNAADIPSVRLLGNGTMAAYWPDQNGPDPEASTVRLAFSTNQGKTWSAPVTPYKDASMTEHGFVSLFQSPGTGAGLGLVWLDGRAQAAKEDADMAMRSATFDATGKQLRETFVDPRVCECCSTSSAITPEGVIVAYRDRTAGEIRDIYVSTFNGTAWSAPVRVHADNWKIDGCPVNGPSISARGREVAVAWFTAKNDQGQAWVAFSHDAGHTFAQSVRVDDVKSLGHVSVQLLADNSAVVSWMEMSGEAELHARRVTAAGTRSPVVNVAPKCHPDSRSPKMIGNDKELLFAWTENDDKGVDRVMVARAAMPAN